MREIEKISKSPNPLAALGLRVMAAIKWPAPGNARVDGDGGAILWERNGSEFCAHTGSGWNIVVEQRVDGVWTEAATQAQRFSDVLNGKVRDAEGNMSYPDELEKSSA